MSEGDADAACYLEEPLSTEELVESEPDGPIETLAPETVFPQSVASSGPTPRGVILWTRIAPEAVRADRSLFVEIGPESGEGFTRSLEIDAGRIGATHDHTVRVDLDGELAPDTRYRYRFVYDGVASATGHCRTLPRPSASPDSLRLGVLACQDYQNGYYGALERVAEEDLDFLVHLGDFIYNSAARQFTGLGSDYYGDRTIDLPSGHDRAWSLADIRTLYRTYLSDPHLQKARENHTMLRVWDDHAIANNRHWDYEADAPRAPDHPRGDDPAFMRELTAAGCQAFWEYTPARFSYDPDADHLHDRFELYRQVQFGDLATLLLTDERLYRSGPPEAPGPLPGWPPFAPGVDSPDRTMLGDTQRSWFTDHLEQSTAAWTIWANEVLSMPLRAGIGGAGVYPKTDSWDGFPAERRAIMDAMANNDRTNFVTLTGDMHTCLAGYQRRRYQKPPREKSEVPAEERVGIEFMTPSATSVNVAEAVGVEDPPLSTVTRPLLSKTMGAMNPYFEYLDSHHWGYATVEFTREQCTFTAHSVEKTVDPANASKSQLRQFTVPVDSAEIRDTGGKPADD